MNKLVVDFDSTLCHTDFPIIHGQNLVNKLVSAYVRYKRKQGWVIILNTMREYGKGLEEALLACEEFNIPIDYYNENCHADIEKWGDSRKIDATLNIDDRNIGFIGFLLRKFG